MLKRQTKILSFIIIVLVLLLLFTNSVFASSSGIKDINETISLMDDNDVQFSHISYKNLSNTNTKRFGLSGFVLNRYDSECSFNTTASYYDVHSNIIVTSYMNQVVPAGEYSSYDQMSNLSEIPYGYTVDDIAFYKLDTDVCLNNLVVDNEHTTNTIGDGIYAITKYHVDMVVNENNTFDITEKITVNFNTDRHGISREIPLKNTVNRIDGTSSKNRAEVSNINVDNNFTSYKEKDYCIIRIGTIDSTIIGEKEYTIQYNYNIGKDPSKDFDELYFNLIGTGWDTTISNFSFTIIMPKEFNKSKLGFSLGSLGSTDSSNINYTVNGNVITGSCNRVVNPAEALTVRMELPEGYFVGATNIGIGNYRYLLFIIPLIFVGISFLIWRKYGKDDQVIETLEFYPPEGWNSLEIGYLYKGKADVQDVVSLLIYLANKGYIKISEVDEKTLFSTQKGLKITKLKEYDGDNVNEKLFFNGLFTKKRFEVIFEFKKKPVIDHTEHSDGTTSEVTTIDLYNNFYITIKKILGNVNVKENKNKIFEKNASSKKIFLVLMIIATFCLITILPMVEFGEAPIIAPLISVGIVFSMFLLTLFDIIEKRSVQDSANSSAFVSNLIVLIALGAFTLMFWLMMMLEPLKEEKVYLYGHIFGLICIIGMLLFVKNLPKRTPYGNQILGKILGFKKFLDTAEKQKLEALVMKNPEYFYDILPYTYVLGVSDKWMKKFETIALQAPNWYHSDTTFTTTSFSTFMNSTMTSAFNAMSSGMSDSAEGGSSGGGSSGGGSSGGGSGGGGGSSW